MKKILLSSVVVVAAAAVVVGATTAFFSDTETSTGNTFTAGSIDLKVDSDCHYWNLVDEDYDGDLPTWEDENGNLWIDVGCGEVGQNGVGIGQWSETDLEDGVHKFFSFSDLKPGDRGEDTISLHVYNNDAWGRILMSFSEDNDNSCTEPEEESDDQICGENEDGELLEAMLPGFSMWLDQGSVPGFQCVGSAGVPVPSCNDSTEGDNVWQPYEGRPWNLSDLNNEKEISEVLANAYEVRDCDATEEVDGEEVPLYSADGHNDYGTCHGLAEDGRMVGSTTYYFGLNWKLPLETGNEVQTDSLSGDLSFEVEQHRNNPSPF